uniref:Uncharacterized protein n=1 Tax=Medicago truncatula TaxID=3880 RepID=I3SAN2_MEDTR|nr:unknown [Medicago truncatula]
MAEASSLGSDNRTSCLMKHGVNFIPIFHLQLIGSLFSTETTPIKEKSNGVEIHRLTITVSIHKLFQLSVPLDPEEHFITILTLDLEVDVSTTCFWLLVFLVVGSSCT